MSTSSRARHAVELASGKIKQGTGWVRGHGPLQRKAKRQQDRSHLKQAGDHLRSALRRH